MPSDRDPPSAAPPDPDGGPTPAGRRLIDALFAEVEAHLEPGEAGSPPPAATPTLVQLRDELTSLYAGMLAATAQLDRDRRLDPATRAAAIAALHDLRAALHEIGPHGARPGNGDVDVDRD